MEGEFTLDRPFSGVRKGDCLYFVDGHRIYKGNVEDLHELDDGLSFIVKVEGKCTVYLNVPREDVNEYSVPVIGFDECFSDVRNAVDTARRRILNEISKWNGVIEYLNGQLKEVEKMLDDAE